MSRRTALEIDLQEYGKSVLGAPLRWIPPKGDCELLLIAGIHGEEPDTTVTLSRALRSLSPSEIAPDVGAILCANPDGVALGTRGNANGVDLNRNFPTANWQPEPTTCRWHADEAEEIPILTGTHPASEPESKALIDLIDTVSPREVITLHGPLACIDDPDNSPLGNWLAGKTGLPLVAEIGYPTPGSMGTWAAQKGLPWITWEFPPEGLEALSRSQSPVLREVLRGEFPRGDA